MNRFDRPNCATTYFRGIELSPGAIEAPNRVDPQMIPQRSTEIEGRAGESEALSPEREKQLEAWMEQIKTFIRGIDVSSL